MKRISKVFIFGFVLALIAPPRIHAQAAAIAPADTKPTAANPAPAGQGGIYCRWLGISGRAGRRLRMETGGGD